jgi:DNA-binding MarR family transcriptional regulator
MRLEEEIKQNKDFKNEHQKLIVNIIYTSNWFRQIHVKRLKPYGISPEQFNVLRILRGQHPCCSSNQMIMERMLDKSSNCSRIVDKLKEKKLVDRKENDADRRLVDIAITEKGMKLLSELDAGEADLQKIFERINLNEVKLVNHILDNLRG